MSFNKKSGLLAVALFSAFGYIGSASADDTVTQTVPTIATEDKFDVEGDFTGFVGLEYGGVYANYTNNLSIKNSTFTNNAAMINGGALANYGVINEGIINTVFQGNRTLYKSGTGDDVRNGQAGALYNGPNAAITGAGIYNTVFDSNTSTRFGGAISNWGTIYQINNSVFLSNKAGTSGGAISGAGTVFLINNTNFVQNTAEDDGGAISTRGHYDLIQNSTFSGNKASGYGGAIELYESTEFNEYGSIGTIDNVIFENNSSAQGGALYNSATIGSITNSTFNSNTATGDYYWGGGAIRNTKTIGEITNSTFTSNSAVANGGAIFNYGVLPKITSSKFEDNSSGERGGAIYSVLDNNASMNIDNTIFKNNFVNYSDVGAGAGGALCIDGGSYTISNSEFRGNYVNAPNASGWGGAISAWDTNLTLNDTSFYDNKIHSKNFADGAAIDAMFSTVNINALNKNVIFSGNTIVEGGETYREAINLGESVLNLNAYNNNKIIFDDRINGSGDTVNINNNIPVGNKPGEIIFNDIVKCYNMNIKAGTAKAGAPKYYSYGSYVSNINPYNLSVSGTLDLANNYVEVMGLGLLDFSDQGKVVLDADLGTNSMDWFDVYKISDNFGKINVKDINILSESSLVDGATNHVPFIIGADVSNKMTFPTLFTSTNRYDLSSSSYLADTLVDFTKRENQGGFVNLSKYSPIEKENISYSMTLDEHLTENLKPFSSNIKSVTIRGNNHNISSDGTSGFQLGNTQTLELKDIGTVSGFKGSNGSFLYNGGTAEIARAAFKNNSSTSNGGVISTSGILNITDSDFINNKANGQGGAIYAASGATVNIYANEKDVTFSGNTASGFTNSIYMDNSSILNLNPASDKKISIAGISGSSAGYSININKGQKDGGIVELTDRVTNATANGGVHLYGGTLRLTNDSFLNMNDLSLHGCTLDMANGFTGTMYLRGLSLENTTNLSIDADLANGIVDTVLPFGISGSGKLNISNINVTTDTMDSKTTILFSGQDLGNANLTPYMTNSVSQAKGPIFLYDVLAVTDGTDYKLVFTNSMAEDTFSPNVLSGPVSAQLAGFVNQLNLYDVGFGSLDTLSSLTREQRQALILANKYAQADTPFANEYTDEAANAYHGNIWFKPYATIEKVPLSDGPDVKNFAYGGLVGTDLGLYDLGSGWSGGASVFGGYTGSTQSYDDVDIWQNGGSVGLSGMLFKNDFFIGATANAGGSGINANYDDGRDDFGMLTTGAALKMGYNFNLAKGKIIVQPHLATSYSYVKTSNFENPNGDQINSKGLHAWQVAPGLKIVGNFKNNWQPYLGVDFMWNILDKARFSAEDVSLPDLSIDPYLQYGLGVQKKIGDRFTGYAQVTARNIGRTGISFALGGKWELGK